jgi:hypothetical protein
MANVGKRFHGTGKDVFSHEHLVTMSERFGDVRATCDGDWAEGTEFRLLERIG